MHATLDMTSGNIWEVLFVTMPKVTTRLAGLLLTFGECGRKAPLDQRDLGGGEVDEEDVDLRFEGGNGGFDTGRVFTR